ncbi:MAG TPA: DUF2252 domain-containing protein [Streptosporangiaceae bacterium]|nr:DUF2252 domain-containing protein [Streptosporangiaceae bacterium]HYA51138.1 DUF2252 domain-containing protein [Streptosporangiaceae bacterium]
MTVKTEHAARGGKPAARAPGGGRPRAGRGEQPSRADREARGKDARAAASLESQAEFGPDRSRDPVGLLLEQDKSRVPDLVPIRHGRMLVSPFTYFRGAALPMAADLATTPASGLRAQLCGDAHLANFGAFASPSRQLVFDVNDFDETLPGPFEWDVKRLAASLVVAGRNNGFGDKACRKIVLAGVERYRTAMREFAGQPFLAVWYAHMDVEDVIAHYRSQLKKKRVKAADKLVAKAHTHDSMKALRKLTTQVDGRPQIISDPPLIEPVEEVFPDEQARAIYEQIRQMLGKYQRTLQSDRKHLLEQFTLVQAARKVVGVGSVGTRCWIALMEAGDGTEPLFLQPKEAVASSLAAYCGRSQYASHGERVVAGQLLMQAESDIFLGWTHVTGPDGVEHNTFGAPAGGWTCPIRSQSGTEPWSVLLATPWNGALRIGSLVRSGSLMV